eukprot:6504342-Alexandrium_andersonii.AAC.1
MPGHSGIGSVPRGRQGILQGMVCDVCERVQEVRRGTREILRHLEGLDEKRTMNRFGELVGTY